MSAENEQQIQFRVAAPLGFQEIGTVIDIPEHLVQVAIVYPAIDWNEVMKFAVEVATERGWRPTYEGEDK